MSPSVRKVWIEISESAIILSTKLSPSVRKVWIEILQMFVITGFEGSPSVRKVWIEICSYFADGAAMDVTFRKEGVD